MAYPAMDEFGRKLAAVDDPLSFLAGIFQRSPVAYQVYDAEGRCVLTNDSFRRLMGVDPPPGYRLLGSRTGGGHGMADLLRQALRGETVSAPTFWFDPHEVRSDPAPDARPVAVSCTAFPLQDVGEEPAHVVFAFLDQTTERLYQRRLARRGEALRAIARRERETRRALEEETARLDASRMHLVASQRIAAVGSWELDLGIADLNANPLRWSDECFRVFGFEPGSVEVSNELFFSRVHEDDRAAVVEAVRRALDTGTVYSIEHRVVLPDGTQRIVHERAEILRDPVTGAPFRMIGTTQDVTEQRRLQDALARAQRMEIVGRLAGGIAHDFNNILTAILGFSQLAEDPATPEASRTAFLRQVGEAAERGATLTRRLLAYARRDMVRCERLDVGDVVRRLRPALAEAVGEGIALEVTEPTEPCIVRIDRGHLEQVLRNLVANAREAMVDGGTVTVATGTDRAPGSVVGEARSVLLTVRDDGPGMSREVLAQAFEPFFSTKGPSRGSGLGLALCQGIIERHGGSISIESAEGAGTTVLVRLPASDGGGTATPVPARTPPPALAAAATAAGRVILLVDDHPQVRAVAEEALRGAGFRVITAADGLSALAAAAAAPSLDLVVTDMVMPGLTGRDVIERLRAERPDLPVILCSGYSDDPHLAADLQAHRIPFLPKPFTADGLVATVRRALRIAP